MEMEIDGFLVARILRIKDVNWNCLVNESC